MNKFLTLLLFSVFLISCGTTQNVGSATEKQSVMKGNKMLNPDPSIDLVGHLRKFAGVRIQGQGRSAEIFIRSQNKKNSQVAIFVDGKQMYSFADAYALTSGTKLEYIEVLKDAGDVAFYGVRGAEGVINIKTR